MAQGEPLGRRNPLQKKKKKKKPHKTLFSLSSYAFKCLFCRNTRVTRLIGSPNGDKKRKVISTYRFRRRSRRFRRRRHEFLRASKRQYIRRVSTKKATHSQSSGRSHLQRRIDLAPPKSADEKKRRAGALSLATSSSGGNLTT